MHILLVCVLLLLCTLAQGQGISANFKNLKLTETDLAKMKAKAKSAEKPKMDIPNMKGFDFQYGPRAVKDFLKKNNK